VTNHVHLIVWAKEGYSLPDILRDYKKFTSKEIKKAISENCQESRKECLPAKAGLLEHFETQEGFRFWHGDNKPIELWSNKVIDQKIDYLPFSQCYWNTLPRAKESESLSGK
jgi:REP element-mobilizing transposase RayT